MLDEGRQCWWSLPPRAGTVVLFRSDLVLHKVPPLARAQTLHSRQWRLQVEPCHKPRYALTVFFSVPGQNRADAHDTVLAATIASLAFTA